MPSGDVNASLDCVITRIANGMSSVGMKPIHEPILNFLQEQHG